MQVSKSKKKTKAELLNAVDECASILELCELVKSEDIVIRMQSFSLASNLPRTVMFADMSKSPLDNLKDRVRSALSATE